MAEAENKEPWLPDWFWEDPPPKPPSLRHLAKVLSFAPGVHVGQVAPLRGPSPQAITPKVQTGRFSNRGPQPQHPFNTAFDQAAILAHPVEPSPPEVQAVAQAASQRLHQDLIDALTALYPGGQKP